MTQDHSAAAFSGSVPDYYDRYLGPVLFDPYAANLVTRLPTRAGLRVLEVACGTGVLTRRLRSALAPDATLVATDLSPAMLAYAQRAVDAPHIAWQVADAQALPFDDASFDLVVCQFGLMFLPDKVAGFREARRVLAPGGQLLAWVWESLAQNPFAAAMQSTLASIVAGDPPTILETIHGYHDTEQITADLCAAGWDDIAFEHVALRGQGPSAAEFATGFAHGTPVTRVLAERGADPEDFIRELVPRLVAICGDAPFTPRFAALLISATR